MTAFCLGQEGLLPCLVCSCAPLTTPARLHRAMRPLAEPPACKPPTAADAAYTQMTEALGNITR